MALVDALGVDEEEVTPQATLVGDLGAESIDFLDIVFKLEKAFSVEIPRKDLSPEDILTNAAYVQDGKPDKAVAACDMAIRMYPTGDKIPEAYYRKGLALSNLKDLAGARSAWETLIKNFPDSSLALLAQQGLERLKKP